MAYREMESARRARSCDRKSALPLPFGTRHQRSSSVGPNTQCVYSTPSVIQGSATARSSSRGTSTRKFLGNVQLPIGDKEFHKYAVNKVRHYFEQHSHLNIRWPSFGSQPPPVAVTVEMFNFLLKMIFKGTCLDVKNYADELPRYMKLLSYPVNIQKSSLVTINTKNTWPSVISMLVFLVDHVSTIDKSEVSEMIFPDREDFQIQSELFWHSLRIYEIWNRFPEGEDEPNIREANEELKKNLAKLHPVDDREMKDMEEAIKVLKMELEKTKSIHLEEGVQMLQDKMNKLNKDMEMIQLEISKLQNRKNEMESQIKEKKNKLHLLEESNQKKLEEIQKLEELCNTQKMTVEDKERIQQECTELRQRIKDAEDLCSSLKAASYQSEQEIANIKIEVDNPFVELKKFQCEKIPEVSGLKIESRYDLHGWQCVKSELHNLRKQLDAKILHLIKCHTEQKKAVSLWKEQLAQLLQDEINGKRRHQDLEERKEKLKSEMKESDANVTKIEDERGEKLHILNKIKTEFQDLIAQLEDYKKQYANKVSETEQKTKDMEEELQWMKRNLKEIKNDFIERTGFSDISL